MASEAARIDADLQGPVSPPRDNGEIVFAEPWERRAFGVTVALCRSGACSWDTFRDRLIRRIAEDDVRPYWRSWAAALEDVLTHAALVELPELDDRHRLLSNRPTGFDH
ncbi:nitrile hydratase accessory protein [Mycobacterium sp. B14F4]|uniref:nitrile hydratase accessory protein n=1 Tax=Mycobacterium sp. B14F4 TaxID=3153565 RepID=UPI00325CA813